MVNIRGCKDEGFFVIVTYIMTVISFLALLLTLGVVVRYGRTGKIPWDPRRWSAAVIYLVAVCVYQVGRVIQCIVFLADPSVPYGVRILISAWVWPVSFYSILPYCQEIVDASTIPPYGGKHGRGLGRRLCTLVMILSTLSFTLWLASESIRDAGYRGQYSGLSDAFTVACCLTASVGAIILGGIFWWYGVRLTRLIRLKRTVEKEVIHGGGSGPGGKPDEGAAWSEGKDSTFMYSTLELQPASDPHHSASKSANGGQNQPLTPHEERALHFRTLLIKMESMHLVTGATLIFYATVVIILGVLPDLAYRTLGLSKFLFISIMFGKVLGYGTMSSMLLFTDLGLFRRALTNRSTLSPNVGSTDRGG